MKKTLRCRGITKAFPLAGLREKVALKGVELCVSAGECLMVLGRSGCGKSTLLHMMAGTTMPTSGEVAIDGVAVAGPDPSRVLLTQQPMLLPWLTVFENVAFGLRVRREKGDLKKRVGRALDVVGLQGQSSYLPSQLSLGMQQRVCMARSLVGNPSLLMLDEPFGALDALTRCRLHREVIRLRKERPETTLIFVTHDLDEALTLGSRVVVLGGEPGRIVADFPVPGAHPRDSAEAGLRQLKEDILSAFKKEAPCDD